MRTMLRTLVLLVLLLLPVGPLAAGTVQHLLYEVLPTPPEDTKKTPASHAFDARTFERRNVATARIAGTVVPIILRVLNLPPEQVKTELTYGGWMLQTNPTLRTTVDLPDDAADRLAAALGFVFRQDSVMIHHPLTNNREGVGVVMVELHKPSPALAHAFFTHAAARDRGAGMGYTMQGPTMLYFNMTDDRGKPYSGLSDHDLLYTLGAATNSFRQAVIDNAANAKARFIENDWKTAPDGEAYANRLDPMTAALLRSVRSRHDETLRSTR